MPQSLTDILEDRGASYGDYTQQAICAQTLKRIVHGAPTRADMGLVQRESLDLICTKMSRILTGDPHHLDSWVDIAGYAQLVVDRLREQENPDEDLGWDT
jgi:hypothetical protein